jgi:hypothetical protein
VTEIYFKKLTRDLLEVCRMLDDKPEAKNRLSEITADVSFLPDVGYGFDKWATGTPTTEGWYWVTNKRGEVGLVEVTSIENGVFWAGGYDFDHDEVGGSFDEITHWLGPLPIPEPPK